MKDGQKVFLGYVLTGCIPLWLTYMVLLLDVKPSSIHFILSGIFAFTGLGLMAAISRHPMWREYQRLRNEVYENFRYEPEEGGAQ